MSLERPVTTNTSTKVLMQNLKLNKLGQSPFFIGPVQRYVYNDVRIVKATKTLKP